MLSTVGGGNMTSLIRRFYIIGALIVAVIAFGLLFQYQYFDNIMMDATRSLTKTSKDAVNSKISSALLGKAQVINSISDYIAVGTWNNEDLLQYMKKSMTSNKEFASLYYGTIDNKMINASGWIPPKTFDLRSRPWYIKAVKEKKLVFTEAFVNASKDKLIITIAKPIYTADNKLIGVVAGDVSIVDIISLVKNNKMDGNGYSFLIDGKGNILAHPKYTYSLDSKIKTINEISTELSKELSDKTTGVKQINLDGVIGFLAYQRIENTDWEIASFIPLNDYLNTENQFSLIFIITFLSSLALLLVFLWQQRRSIIMPMSRLSDDIQIIDIEKNTKYRLSEEKNDIFINLRKVINSVLNNGEETLVLLEKEKEELRRTESKQKAMIANISDIIAIHDSDGVVKYVSPNIEKWFGWNYEDLLGADSIKVVHPDDRERFLDIFNEILQGDNFESVVEFKFQCKNGEYKEVEARGVNLFYNSDIKGVLWNLNDITIRKAAQEEIVYLSYHDKLTGLYNRRFYEEEIRRLDIERNLPISIIIGDVNGLKILNDAFGHDKGDELLKKAAHAIYNACRADDIVARWGGDEFVVLLPKTRSLQAEEITNRIKASCLNESVSGIKMSISFGWETKSNADDDVFKVLKSAEDFMYKHKIVENEGVRGNIINTIINTLHEKNAREEQHSKRVSEICQIIGREIGFTDIQISRLKVIGLLHDIGKIGIDEGILNKPEALTRKEMEEIKRHPDIGYRILSSSVEMSELADGVLAHHERWDGKGYPKGLIGEEIPKIARIIALADSYDAMTSERPYREALEEKVVLSEIKKNAGIQYDPVIARLFIEKVLGKNWDEIV